MAFNKDQTASLLGADIAHAPSEVIKWLQGQKLAKLVEYACKNVPYYRRSFSEHGITPSDIRSINDIARLPLMDESAFIENYPFGLFAVSKEKQRYLSLKKTSKEEEYIVSYCDSDQDAMKLYLSRALELVKIKSSDIIQTDCRESQSNGNIMLFSEAVRASGCCVLPISSETANEHLQSLRRFGVDALCCGSDYALELARLAAEQSIEPSQMRLRTVIVTCSDKNTLAEADRAFIEQAFGVKVFSFSGILSHFIPGAAAECIMQDGFHLSEDIFYAEIIDPDTGTVLPEGVKGELVITMLNQGAYPILRMRTNITAALNHFPCACGCNFVRIVM